MANQSTPKRFIYNTGGTGTFVVPTDWNNKNNSIEVIGAGGGASVGANQYAGGGGGGGAYAKSVNVALTVGATTYYQVGTYGTGGKTAQTPGANGTNSWFNSVTNAQPTTNVANTLAIAGLRANTAAAGTQNLGGLGGNSLFSLGDTIFAGGAGGNGAVSLYFGGGGGGAAGSIYGAGFNGANGGSSGGGGGGGGGVKGAGAQNSTTTGGAGGANATSVQASGGAVETAGNAGINGGGGAGGGGSTGAGAIAGRGGNGGGGTEYTDTVSGLVTGAGGGGAGGGGASAATGVSSGGGLANTAYGAGGGGGAAGGGRGTSNTNSSNGANGLVVITYLPVYLYSNVGDFSITGVAGNVTTSAYFVNNGGNSPGSKLKIWWANTSTLGNSANTNSYYPNNAGNTTAKVKAWWANTSTLGNQTNTSGSASYNSIRIYPTGQGYQPIGNVATSGAATTSQTQAYYASGLANTSGAALILKEKNYATSGVAVTSGSGSVSTLKLFLSGGAVTTFGSSDYSKDREHLPTGTLELSGNVGNPEFVITIPSAYDGYYNEGGNFEGVGGTINMDYYDMGGTVSAPISWILNRNATGTIKSEGTTKVSFQRLAANASGTLSTDSTHPNSVSSLQKSWEANTSTLNNIVETSGAGLTNPFRIYYSTISGVITVSGTVDYSKDRQTHAKGTMTLSGPGAPVKADGSAWIRFDNAYEPYYGYPALKLNGKAATQKTFNIVQNVQNFVENRSVSGTLKFSGAASQTDYTSGATYKFLYPNTDIQSATWYNSDDTQTNMYDYINEEDAIDTDYIWTNTLNSEYIVKLDTTARVIKRNGWSLNFRAASPDGTNITLTTTFYYGSNVIASWNDPLGSTLSFIKHDLTSGEIQSLPTYGNNFRVGFKIS